MELTGCDGSTFDQDAGTFSLGDCTDSENPNYKEAAITFNQSAEYNGASLFMGKKSIPLQCGFKQSYSVTAEFKGVEEGVIDEDAENDSGVAFDLVMLSPQEGPVNAGEPVQFALEHIADIFFDDGTLYTWAPTMCKMTDVTTGISVDLWNVATDQYQSDLSNYG